MNKGNKKLQEIHEKIRSILIESWAVEYWDVIVDEICNIVWIKTTNEYYTEWK